MSTTVKKEVISWVKTILLAAVLAGLVNSFLIVNAEVPTGSMENTIMAGDRILALRTSYWFDEPEAGDIVVFRYPDDETGKRFMSSESSALPVIPLRCRTARFMSMARPCRRITSQR